MALSLDFCEDSDMHRVFTIISNAFGDDQPYIDVQFPNHKTDTGRAQGEERLLQMKHNDPHATFLKVTDTATGEIIGQAKWLVYKEEPEILELGGDYWETEEEKQYAAQLYAGYVLPRRDVIKSAKGPVVCLDILTVDPKHHFRGAGSKLVKWGVELADQMGAEMVVEASVFARHLYEQNGFCLVKHYKIDMPEKWANKPKIRFLFMQRPASKESN